MPGTPEAWAYAMPTGTSMVVITMPATASCLSHDAWYRRSVCSPGTHRSQLRWFAGAASRAMRPGSITKTDIAALSHGATKSPGRSAHGTSHDFPAHEDLM